MIELANAIAPEHVELIVRQPAKLAKQIRNAGAMFLGPYSAPPLGDYLAGPESCLADRRQRALFFAPRHLRLSQADDDDSRAKTRAKNSGAKNYAIGSSEGFGRSRAFGRSAISRKL